MDTKIVLGIFFIAFCICLKVITGIIETGISNADPTMLLIWSTATIYTGIKIHKISIKQFQKKANTSPE